MCWKMLLVVGSDICSRCFQISGMLVRSILITFSIALQEAALVLLAWLQVIGETSSKNIGIRICLPEVVQGTIEGTQCTALVPDYLCGPGKPL